MLRAVLDVAESAVEGGRSGFVVVGHHMAAVEDVLEAMEKAYEKKQRLHRQAAWENWVVKACEGSAAGAYRYLKEKPVTLDTVGIARAGTPEASSLATALLEEHGRQWAEVWGCNGAEDVPAVFEAGESLPPRLHAR